MVYRADGMDLADGLVYFMIFVVSFLPIAEVRGGIPLAFAYFHNDIQRLVLGIATSVIGNMLVAPFVLLLLRYIDIFIRNSHLVPKSIKNTYAQILSIVNKRSRKLERYDIPALAVFVGVPLPITGAWTGSLIAFLIGMDRRRALIAIEIGVLIATVIVTAVCTLGLAILKNVFLIPTHNNGQF